MHCIECGDLQGLCAHQKPLGVETMQMECGTRVWVLGTSLTGRTVSGAGVVHRSFMRGSQHVVRVKMDDGTIMLMKSEDVTPGSTGKSDQPRVTMNPAKKTYYSAPRKDESETRIEVECVTTFGGVQVMLRNARTGASTCIVVVHEHGISLPHGVNAQLIAVDDTGRVAIVD